MKKLNLIELTDAELKELVLSKEELNNLTGGMCGTEPCGCVCGDDDSWRDGNATGSSTTEKSHHAEGS